MSALDPLVTRQLAEDLAPDVFRMIIETFEADLSRLAAEITAAGQAGNRKGYESAAHSLAGTAAGIGAMGLEREARIAMDRRQPETIEAVLPRLRAEADGVLLALRKLLA